MSYANEGTCPKCGNIELECGSEKSFGNDIELSFHCLKCDLFFNEYYEGIFIEQTWEENGEEKFLRSENSISHQAKSLLLAAEEIIDDFENFGEVLQQDEDFEYGPNSAIGRLIKIVKEIRNETGNLS
jgi:hypothetical protein